MSESEETPNVGEMAPAPVAAADAPPAEMAAEAPPAEVAATPAPEPEPEAAPAPAPVEPEVASAPTAEPEAAPTAEPEAAPTAEPEAAPTPEPEATPAPAPAPAPVVEPVAEPAPAPEVKPAPKITTPPAKQTPSKAPNSVDKGVSPPPTGKSNLTPGNPPGQEARKTSDFKAPSPPVVELTPLEKTKKNVREFFDSMPAAIVMSIVTLWALFGDDIRIATCPKSMDTGFTISLSICFFMFLMEFMGGVFASPEYINLTYVWGEKFEMKHIPGSFYFYLDIIATASLGLELSWMNGGDDTEDAGEWVDSGEFESNTGSSSTSQRLVTMLRMVRIVRMVKFYKYYQINQKKRELRAKALKRAKARKSFNSKDTSPVKVEEEAEVRESSVGQAMTALTTQRVLVLVFGMLFIIPLFTEADSNMEARYKAEMYRTFSIYKDADTNNTMDLTELDDFLFTDDFSTLAIVKDDDFISNRAGSLERLSEYRPTEVQVLSSGGFTVFQKNKINAVEGAKFSMGLTAFITVLLMVGTMVFSHDVRSLVITPIEHMVELVQKIAVNPLGVDYSMNDDDDAFAEGMETTLLLQTINKIGSLMRVGFGEAGANVIAKNLAESKGGKLNMMGAGTTITSIFGFCDVRQFTDTTECLQEEVMLFVNRIAHILHSIVVQCSGAANKNIGDAFLLTWKLEEGNTTAQNTALADQALVAFLKGLVELNRHQDFICNFSVAATTRLFKRFPGYNVRIGCGLHVGWAIEGAIGTHRKIDASYLSPSVNMSEYLESSTKAYGVPILLSEPFYKLLSVHATKYCRQVDSIFGPLEKPFGMFTYDSDLDYDFNAVVATTSALKAASVFKSKLAARKANRDSGKTGGGDGRRRSSMFGGMFDSNAGPPEKRPKRISIIAAAPQRRGSAFNDIEMQKISETQKKLQEERKNKAPEIKVNAYEKGVWERDADLIQLRHLVNDSFRVTWAGGIKAYISGDWAEAIRIFTQTLDISRGTDGPSKFLLELMNGHGGRAPADWKGYRLD